MNNEQMTFGGFLRECRGRKNFSLRELAKQAGMHHSFLSRLENDRKHNCSVRVLLRISEALGLWPDERERLLHLATNANLAKSASSGDLLGAAKSIIEKMLAAETVALNDVATFSIVGDGKLVAILKSGGVVEVTIDISRR